VGKRKANELDSSDSGGSLEPATRRPATLPKPGVSSAPLPTQAKGTPPQAPEKCMGEQPETSGRQLSYAEATKPSGTLKPTAKETGTAAVAAASKDAAHRHKSAGPSGSVLGPLSGKPEGTNFTAAQVEGRVPPGERSNKTPVYVSGVSNTRKFLEWIREKTARKLLAQMRGETLMLVPETEDGFRAIIGNLRSHGEDKGVSFQTFSLPDDRCVRLLLKNVGKRMPVSEIKEELEALSISVQAVMQLRSNRRDYEPEKKRPLTPHFVVSVARDPDVAKVLSLTAICGLRVRVATTGPLQCKRCLRFGHTQRNCGYAPRCVACGDAHPSGTCATSKQQLKCCSCGGTTLQTIAVTVSGRRQRRPLQSARKDGAATRLASPHACRHANRPQLDFPRIGETGPGLEPRGSMRPRR
jgi:hypothetical protein